MNRDSQVKRRRGRRDALLGKDELAIEGLIQAFEGLLLPRAIGTSRAFEIRLTGRDVSAREAAEIGLVSRTVPDAELLLTCLDLAEQISGWSTQGVQLMRRMIWSGLETSSHAAAVELESHTQLYMGLTTKNFEDATKARKEGRKPVFCD